MEVFSPERVARVCREFALVAGPALDLATGYDFSKPSDRATAMEILKREEPELVMLSPPCGTFSIMQSCTPGPLSAARRVVHWRTLKTFNHN